MFDVFEVLPYLAAVVICFYHSLSTQTNWRGKGQTMLTLHYTVIDESSLCVCVCAQGGIHTAGML